MKPYAVTVTFNGKVTGKEFDTEEELTIFLAKAEELKEQAPTLLVKVTRNGLPKKAKPKTAVPDIKRDPRKDESLCWQPAYRDGVPMVDYKGEQLYNCIPVPPKPHVLFCPYCNTYKKWVSIKSDYDLDYKGCETCGIADQDFYVKTANSLWKRV